MPTTQFQMEYTYVICPINTHCNGIVENSVSAAKDFEPEHNVENRVIDVQWISLSYIQA